MLIIVFINIVFFYIFTIDKHIVIQVFNAESKFILVTFLNKLMLKQLKKHH